MESPLKISRILHAGYVFEWDQTQIVFDPIFENPFSHNCYAFPNVAFNIAHIQKLKPSAVFISHYHDDHFSMESLNFLDRANPIYLFCRHEEMFELVRSLGFPHVYALQLDTPVQVGAFTIIPRRALDEDVDCIFQLRVGTLNVLNVVDAWIDPITLNQLIRQGPWDLILWPFQTMREIEVLSPSRAAPASTHLPDEWIPQLKKLNPRVLMPSSCQFIQEEWSWYNHALFPITYRQFQIEAQTLLPLTQFRRMNPGTSIELSGDQCRVASPLSWVTPIGPQDVDYQFQENEKPPTTAHIAKQFPSLSPAATNRVLEYCRHELADRYQVLEIPNEDYFAEPKTWKLSTYDHTGHGHEFYYQIKENQMVPTLENERPVAWLTEIPMAKFYSALENGEALTSLYIRINDIVFSPEIEKQLLHGDVLNDPLIRCLFTAPVGAYQNAQLRRLNLIKEKDVNDVSISG